MPTNYNLLENILQEFCDKERIDAVLNEYREESLKDNKLDRKRAYTKHNNKVGTKEKAKTYYQDNKEDMTLKNKEKINCQFCYREVLKTNISRHKKTKTCLKEGQAIALVVGQLLKEI